MCHDNKNRLVDLHFREDSGLRLRKTAKHVSSCDSCNDYLKSLIETEEIVKSWEDETPMENSFAMIMAEIPDEKPEKSPVISEKITLKQAVSWVSFSLTIVFSLVFAFHKKLTLLPFWKDIEHLKVIEMLGSFGVSLVLLLLLGGLVVMSLAPVIFFESRRPGFYVKKKLGGAL